MPLHKQKKCNSQHICPSQIFSLTDTISVFSFFFFSLLRSVQMLTCPVIFCCCCSKSGSFSLPMLDFMVHVFCWVSFCHCVLQLMVSFTDLEQFCLWWMLVHFLSGWLLLVSKDNSLCSHMFKCVCVWRASWGKMGNLLFLVKLCPSEYYNCLLVWYLMQ